MTLNWAGTISRVYMYKFIYIPVTCRSDPCFIRGSASERRIVDVVCLESVSGPSIVSMVPKFSVGITSTYTDVGGWSMFYSGQNLNEILETW
jgi:hypothetical protein